MKKYTLLLPLLMLGLFSFVPSTSALVNDFCPDRFQAAVDPATDKCRTFANRCAVPESWRHIPSCDLIAEEERPSVEEVLKRRWGGRTVGQFNQARPTSQSTYGSRRYNYRKIGTGRLTGINRRGDLQSNNSKRRRTFTRNITGRSSLHQKGSGYQENIGRTQRRQLARGFGAKRTGALKSASRFSDTRERHSSASRRNYNLEQKHRVWRSLDSIVAENKSRRWKEQLEKNITRLNERRTLRTRPGSATEGDLENYTERD